MIGSTIPYHLLFIIFTILVIRPSFNPSPYFGIGTNWMAQNLHIMNGTFMMHLPFKACISDSQLLIGDSIFNLELVCMIVPITPIELEANDKCWWGCCSQKGVNKFWALNEKTLRTASTMEIKVTDETSIFKNLGPCCSKSIGAVS